MQPRARSRAVRALRYGLLVIRPHAKRDWFQVDRETAKPVWGLPGVGLDPKNPTMFLLHRSHLALFDRAPVLPAASSAVWEARNESTKARGFTLRTAQHQAIDFITARAGALLADDMRVGKGHPHGTQIMTPRGWRSIEDLRVGDQVIGSDGKPCRLTGTFRRGRLPIYRVLFSDGSSICVDGDHLWSVWDHNAWHRGNAPRTIETRQLIGDLEYGNHGNKKWRIPMVKPIELVPQVLPIDPYLLGVLLGDGGFTSTDVSFTPGDELVPMQVQRVLPSRCSLSRTDSEDRATCFRIVDERRGNVVLDALRSLGLWGLKSEKKFVPENYLMGSASQRLALLQGLMDTDGEQWSKGVTAFSSSSAELACAVAFLVESLGGIARESFKAEPRYRHKGALRVGLPSYRLTLALPDGINPFRARASTFQQHAKYLPARLIAAIEPDGEAEVICLAVDAIDQLYVTEHCIVTHNTLSSLMCHDPMSGPLVIIAPLSTRGVWLGWAKRVFPQATIGVLAGKKFDRTKIDGKDVIFAHYDIIKYWQVAMPIGTLVFDEAHLLTKPTSLRSKAAAFLAGRARRVIPMTGTPVWKFPPDFWSILNLAVPGAWGNYFDFAQRYGLPISTGHGWKYGGVSNEIELQTRLSEVMLRRRWIDVADDLPPITRSVVIADVSDAERKRLDILAAQLASERTNTAGNLAHYRRVVSAIKASTVCSEALKIQTRGEPVVVWTWHKELADALAKTLDAFVIHGDITPAERERRIEAWRACPNGILVANMAVAGAGIDLSHARVAIFAEIDYTPAMLGQAEMRTYMPTRPMDIIFIVANHFVDQRIVRALVTKLGAADPLGVGAAVDAIDAMRDAVLGPRIEGDLDRLLEDFLASAA